MHGGDTLTTETMNERQIATQTNKILKKYK